MSVGLVSKGRDGGPGVASDVGGDGRGRGRPLGRGGGRRRELPLGIAEFQLPPPSHVCPFTLPLTAPSSPLACLGQGVVWLVVPGKAIPCCPRPFVPPS